jgi:uncharacterized membrane protein YsdA (DUF1294 family)/cold shock CspA family protein
MRKKGIITKWNDDKGFGFILPNDSQKTIFVHIKSFTDRNVRPIENQKVTYTLEKNDKGYAAINVSRATDNPVRSKTNIHRKLIQKNKLTKQIPIKEHSTDNISSVTILLIGLFVFFIFYFSIIENQFPSITIVLYLLISIFTYFIYEMDKYYAINNKYRISEKSLLLLSLFGGWPGALIAQQKFRHKNKKSSFQISFWLTIFVNIIWISKFFDIFTILS